MRHILSVWFNEFDKFLRPVTITKGKIQSISVTRKSLLVPRPGPRKPQLWRVSLQGTQRPLWILQQTESDGASSCVWHLLLSILLLRSVHAAAYASSSLIFIAE